MSKKDITGKEDAIQMVDSFYAKVNQDPMLSAVFNDHAGVDWEHHLPKMYNFWSTILFADGDYKGSPFDKHKPLPISKEHFTRWLDLFCDNLDEHFEGEMTEHVKMRARTIGWTFQSKMEHLGLL